MMLADMGAEVLQVKRPGPAPEPVAMDEEKDVLSRGRRRLVIDLKRADGRDLLLALCARADVLLEGFRPGVMERLGLGPDVCQAQNPRLIYARVTGWGQGGALAATAGHDINYLAIAGALHAIGHRGERPVPPLNLLGDYAGGGMLATIGILGALIETGRSGKGQVIDAAMIDGVAQLQSVIYGLIAMGRWRPERGVNVFDSGCFYYDTYETADGNYIAVGALEDKFFAEFVSGLGFTVEDFPDRQAPALWSAYRKKVAAKIRTKSRAQWTAAFASTDACVSPVLTFEEAIASEQAGSRHAFIQAGATRCPAPAPRFSRTPSAAGAAPDLRERPVDALRRWGYSASEIEALAIEHSAAISP
jgi:alpha-methylacyl-CoA racemase